MTKVWRVAKNEYLNIVRTKAFVISVVLMPVFMGGAIAAQALLKDKVDLRAKRFAVVDRTGRLHDAIERAAAARPTEEDGRQVRPRFVPEEAGDDAAALSDRVRKGELIAYVVVGEGVFRGDGEIAYHTLTPTYDDLPNWLRSILGAEIRRARFEEANIDQELVGKLSRPTPLATYGLVQVTTTGEVRKAKRVDRITTFGVPMGAMWLLFILVMTSAPLLLNTVLEEKMQRISEILVASVSPFELFLGKLGGIVLVSWTLAGLYLGGVAYVVHRFGLGDSIPVSIYFWFLFFQLLALLIYGAIFSAFGAAASELRDAQSMMMPAMLLVMIPMFVWLPVVKQPDSAFATWVSLFPPATPFLMLVRIGVPPGPPAWEIALGVVLTVLFTLAVVWAGGKIFRVGILAQGQAPSFRKMLAWIPRPKVKAILICDQIIHEAMTNKKSLIGIFEDIHLVNFPCRYPRVAVYVNLTDAHGHYSLGVRLLDGDGNQIGAGKTPAVEIVDKRHTCEFALQIQNLEFKKPGTYEFQILANDDLLETKSFNVKQVQRPAPPDR